MTEREMHKFADILMERIKSYQESLDGDYKSEVDKITALGVEVKSEPITEESIKGAICVLIEQYEIEMQECIDVEDYKKADLILGKINDLKK